MSEKIYNLCYYIGAIDRPMLWYNLWNIKKNLHLFNGKKLITIGMMGDDPTTHSLANLNAQEFESSVQNRLLLVDKIVKYFNDSSITFFGTDNSPACDTLAFTRYTGKLLESTNPNEVTFYGHTKGVRYPGGVDVRMGLWAGIMYRYVFDFEDVKKRLWDEGYAAYGSMKRDGRIQSYGGFITADWHYSGALYWFKHDPFFKRDWNTTDTSRGVMEVLLPRTIRSEEAYCPFDMPETFKEGGDAYDLNNWKRFFGSVGSNITEQMNSFGFDGKEWEEFSFTRHL